MKIILKLEEFGQFALAVYLFTQLDYAWWVFPACILLPDLSMLGYLINPKMGAWAYNMVHHKLLAILILIAGFYFNISLLSLIGVLLFGHSSMDRIFGYGLKFTDSFNNTHLGRIGNNKLK